LAEEIVAKDGAVISEYPPEAEVTKWSFLERNRLVAALADVVIVVEAAGRSGTLNTAMHALEQGKELMAVPGNITSPLSVGCNRLIAQGATPVTCVDDVLEKLGLTATDAQAKQLPLVRDPNQQKIIEIIKSGIVDGDAIMTNAKLTISEFNQALTMLEISGVIRSLGANRWILK
jgi:DNA processing protein